MSDNAPAPNVVEVPLPAGLTPEQFFELQGSIVAVAIAIASAAAAAFWDYLHLLPHEVMLYRIMDKDRWKREPGIYAFIALRYAGVLAFIPALFISALQCSHCMFARAMAQVFSILVTMSAGYILSYRVFSLWKGNKVVYGVVTLYYVLMVASWASMVAVGASLRATQGPPTVIGSNCLLGRVPDWAPLSSVTSLVFDILILGLTLAKLQFKQRNDILHQLHQNCTLYIACITVTNLIFTIIQFLPITSPRITVAKQAIFYFPILVNTAMGSRIYLNLKVHYDRKNNGLLSESFKISTGQIQSRTSPLPVPPSSQVKGVVVTQSSFIHIDPKTDKRDAALRYKSYV